MDVDREITIRDYFDVAWSGRWLILATTVVGIIVGILISVAHHGAYNATARVFMGQPTSSTGNPLESPFTSPQTATQALDMTALSDTVAHSLGVSDATVSGHVKVGLPSTVTATGTAIPVLLVTASNAHPATAIAIANQFANAVVTDTGAQYTLAAQTLAGQVATYQATLKQLNTQIDALKSGSAASAALTADIQLAAATQTNLANAQLALATTRQTSVPHVLAQAYSASTTNTAPKRLESVVLAGLVGFLLGVIATFIWRGSPATRAENG